MIFKFLNTQTVRFLAVSLLFVTFSTSCSASSESQIDSIELMASSGKMANELPKLAQPAPTQIEEAVIAPAAPQLNIQTTETVPLQADSQGESLQAKLPEQPNSDAPEPQQPALPPDVSSLPQEPRLGARAPDFTLETIDGQAMRLSELIGQAVVINYWTTWCTPCQQELPILEKLHREYQQKGVLIVSVNAIDQDSLDKVQETVRSLNMTFPVLLDQGNRFAGVYQLFFFPTTIMIDASGVIREITLGDSTEAELRSSFDRLLSGEL